MARVVAKSKRTKGLQLPPGFIRAPQNDDRRPPVARLLHGGRGGEVRLKLLLSVMMLATSPPFDIKRRIPARAWAEMLSLPSPETLGARRIADALAWLQDHQFVSLQREAGAPPAIALKSPLGDGGEYRRASGRRYVTLPIGFWTHQWINLLSGSGVALLLVLLELQGGRSGPQIVTAERRAGYGLSDDTWRRASAELKEGELLEVKRTIDTPDFDRRRVRNTYSIDEDRLSLPLPSMLDLSRSQPASVDRD